MLGIGEDKVKLVLAMERAKGPAPLGYLTQRTGIEDPRELLSQLEGEGIVRRLSPDSWSPSHAPQYELTGKATKLLHQLIATRLEQLIEVRV